MNTAIKVSQALLYLVAFFLILLSIDAFEASNTFFENVLGFFLHASFGFSLALVTYVLRKQYMIFGLFLVGLSIFFFFFFRMIESFYTILTIFLPIFLSGVIHLMYARNKT